MTFLIIATIAACIAFRATPTARAAYNLARDYSGSNLLSENLWDFYGSYDNTTSGDVNFLDGSDAISQKLAYITPQGTGILKVDNTSNVVYNDKRNSVRITTKDVYPIGSLWVIDALHLPFGCSVWPSIWTTGLPWPAYGEIDIMEAVNLMGNNQYALHTGASCTKTDPSTQTGATAATNCQAPENAGGCTVMENQANSVGSGFAQAGGGVYAAQFDTTGIYMWFWSRPNVPSVITQAASSNSTTLDITSFGNPSAAFPSGPTCDTAAAFGPQKLILDITLCGIWGNASYAQTCANVGTPAINQCYVSNVIGNGSNYADAYFELNYIKGYTLDGVSLLSSSAVNYSLPSAATNITTTGTGSSSSPSASSTAASGGNSTNSASWARGLPQSGLLAVAGLVVLGLSAL